jgi:hypothetical protein
MSSHLTLSFQHTQAGMKVWFKDTLGVWHPLETAPYVESPLDMPSLDPVRAEFAYINTLRAIRPDMGISVEQHWVQ